MHNIELSQV